MPVALTIKKIDGKPGKVYYPLQLKEVPKPTPGPGEVLIRLNAAALNHRDLFIRQHLYPGIAFGHPMLADGQGTILAQGPDCKRSDLAPGAAVVLLPLRGWDAHPDGPEDLRRYAVIGSTQLCDAGTAQEYIVCAEADVEPAPPHLSAAEAAALPLVGLTAWRALVTKAGARAGQNVLVTGVGGGVALQAVQFAVALGCAVYVTSGDKAKVARAVSVGGARGGVSYRDKDWDKQLAELLPKDRPFLDAVIDGAGGDIVAKTVRLLKPGGIISQYGLTVSPKMDWSMSAVMKNIELRGSTMGSRREFRDMIAFVREKQIRPVVSRVVKGLTNLGEIDGLFADMKDGKQFGKLVIEIAPETGPSSKL
ncbi:NAD(P)-binding protein [Cryphonectria parasitica EP155]|uniref:NAD(P)-binding protein n=1 Tax=Cryphonectria parasitica (strain ATCC 38755 / EP155) TaxID=660469 RepID=A0A9P5CQM4_CRYP1|nr:NAD(P)-binding protein [Cryphonectria parasitica EP155]KAF3767388.1 NAD(P)-binding protein [Cryphonectria parasitica EP155]